MTAARRLAAILAAEVAGFTRPNDTQKNKCYGSGGRGLIV